MKLTIVLLCLAILGAMLGYYLNRQSHAEAVRVFCWAPFECQCFDADPSIRATNLAVYLTKHLSNKQVQKALFESGVTLYSEEGQINIAAEVEKAQLTSCPMLEIVRASDADYSLDYENRKVIFIEP